MTLDSIITKMCELPGDPEGDHLEADRLLLDAVDVLAAEVGPQARWQATRLREAFEGLDKWANSRSLYKAAP